MGYSAYVMTPEQKSNIPEYQVRRWVEKRDTEVLYNFCFKKET